MVDFTGFGGLFDFANGVLERLFPNPKDRLDAQAKLAEMQQKGELAQLAADTELMKGQIEVNKVEAASSSLFVSGWRPYIGWTCGTAYLYHFILQPLLAFGFAAFDHPIALPAFDMGELSTVLMGMLGIGAMRSYEKKNGLTK